jgi:bifunctional UDP-N-acetylglucosamine pyrophosphorylase/glucosamine-1-phosphate N-acetyltransferase
MEKIQILILAAGKGKRMESDDPKALAMLRGKPFLKHILDTLENIHLPIKPVIVIGHKKERVKEIIGEHHKYAVQNEQLGTGHAVVSSKEVLNPNYKTLLVLSTDQPLVSKETIENIIQTHEKENSTITIGTLILPDFLDWRAGLINFGRIVRDQNNQVEKIVEYKDADEEERKITEVNPALYAFDADWLWKNIDSLQNKNAQGEYYLTDLIHLAFEQGKKVTGVPISNILEGMQPNTKQELETLEKLLTN